MRRPSAAMSDIGSELHTWQHSEADIFHDAQETIVTHVETTARCNLGLCMCKFWFCRC